jgi:hypothetical protein
MSTDISAFIQAKSDQLNAADLASPIVATITRVEVVRGDQPVIVHIDGDRQPWKPCKTGLRMLAACWGTDGAEWVGRRVRLYNDERVMWAGQKVGGIRVSGMSDISGTRNMKLPYTRGKLLDYTIERLPDVVAEEPTSPDSLAQWLADNNLPAEHLDAYLTSLGAKPATGAPTNFRDSVLTKASTEEGTAKLLAFIATLNNNT